MRAEFPGFREHQRGMGSIRGCGEHQKGMGSVIEVWGALGWGVGSTGLECGGHRAGFQIGWAASVSPYQLKAQHPCTTTLPEPP